MRGEPMTRGLHIVRTSCAAFAAVLLAGATVPAGAQTATINLEAILPMTGQAAFVGQAESQSLNAFEKYVNANGGLRGAPIHFEIRDDQTSPQVALQLTNAAIARKVPVIFGSSVAATCSSIGAAIAASGPVQFCFSPAVSPAKGSYAFATGPAIVDSIRTILIYAKLRGFHRVAYIGSTDATGIATVAANTELFKSPDMRGMELVADERVATGDVTATAQLAKIKAARPDVLWTSTSGTVFGLVIHALADIGLEAPVLTNPANANAAQLKGLGALLPRELYFPGVPYQLGDLLKDPDLRKQSKMFSDAFKMIGVEPTSVHALAWDPLLITTAAYRQFGPTMTADQLKTFTLSQRHFGGLNGFYNFGVDQHGLDSNAVLVTGWDRTKQDFYAASQLGGTPIRR
jgi:branched-chain amino acid transport system substrate-binding protein